MHKITHMRATGLGLCFTCPVCNTDMSWSSGYRVFQCICRTELELADTIVLENRMLAHIGVKIAGSVDSDAVKEASKIIDADLPDIVADCLDRAHAIVSGEGRHYQAVHPRKQLSIRLLDQLTQRFLHMRSRIAGTPNENFANEE